MIHNSLWKDITFKNTSYRKNYDLASPNDSIVTECNGTIHKTNTNLKEPAILIGEYAISIWDLRLGQLLTKRILDILKYYKNETVYSSLIKEIKRGNVQIDNYDRLVIVHSLIIHPNYRKNSLPEEFLEMVYREWYHDKCIIIIHTKPIQYNKGNYDYYFNHLKVEPMKGIEPTPAVDYYGLSSFIADKDEERDHYRVYGVAKRCGMNRVGRSNLFTLSPEWSINRVIQKNLEE